MSPARPVRTAAFVLFATLAILWLAIPRSVSTWAQEYLPAFVQPVSSPIVEAVETAANATRIPLLYEYARESFQSATKK